MKIFAHIVDFIYHKVIGPWPGRKVLTFLAPLMFLSFLIFVIFIALGMDRMLGFPSMLTWPLNVMIAIPILTMGSFLWGWSLLHFFQAKGTPVPFNPPPRLVDTGPYAHVRNPMVSGVLITLFGVGVLLKSISLTFIFNPALFLLIYVELKAIEEPELEMRLGEDYREYKKKVPMFFPRLRVHRQ